MLSPDTQYEGPFYCLQIGQDGMSHSSSLLPQDVPPNYIFTTGEKVRKEVCTVAAVLFFQALDC